MEIFPSRFFPNGSRDNLAGIRAAAERGKKVMSSQIYEIRNALASGGQMRAHFAAFLQFKDGKIVSQRNYDCYEPEPKSL